MIEINNIVDLNFLPGDFKVATVREKEMDVLRFKYRDCMATVGWGDTTQRGKTKLWATVYRIETNNSPKQDTVFLLLTLKRLYEKHGYDFAYSFADTAIIKGILYKLGIKVREQGTGETITTKK